MPSERGYYMQTVTGVKQKYFRTITELVQFYKQPTTLLVSRLIYPITARTQDDDNGSDPRRGTVPGSCQAPAGPVLYAGSPADSMRTSEYKDMMKRMREEVYHLTAIVEEKQSEVNQMKVEMDQMSVDLDEMTVQKREMEQRLDETVQLLRNAEVTLEREEVRLRDNAYHLTAISEEKQREMDQMKEQTRVEMGELELLIDETLQLLKNAKAPGEMAEGRLRDCDHHLTAIIEEKEKEMDHMEIEMDQMRAEKGKLERRIDGTVQLLRDAEAAFEEGEERLRNNCHHLTAINETEQLLGNAQAASNVAEERLRDGGRHLTAIIEETQREMDQMKLEMELMRVEKGDLEQRLDETAQVLRNAEAAFDEAQERLKGNAHHLTAIVEEKQREMDQMKLEMELMRVEKGDLEQRLDETAQVLRNAEAAFDEAQERLKGNAHHLTAIVEEKQREMDQMKLEMELMRVEKGDLEQRLDETAQVLRNAEAAFDEAQERLKGNAHHLTAIVEETQREMGQMKLEMELMRVEKGDLEQRLDETAQVLRNAEAAFDEAQERLKGNAHHLTAIVEEKQREMDQMKLELDQARVEKEELEERMDETVLLLQNAEAAFVEAEERLRDNEQVLKIQAQDVQLSDKELGSGSFGGVRVGYWRGCPVAVKILHEELAKENYQRRLFEQEMSVCSRLHHPNIAAICGVIQQRDAPLSLIMELLQASLADVIEAAHVSGTYLTLREQTDISHDCISGLAYLHNLARPVLHGDIRPTNVLVTSVMRAKLGDLGAARFTDASLSVGPMSPLYVAPERLADRTLPNTREADLYSMGVSLGELFTGDQLDRKDRILQLRSVRQRGLRLVCVKMACEDSGERMMASAALTVNDRVVKTEEYRRCGPRRMVKGLVDGVDKVTLCEKPW